MLGVTAIGIVLARQGVVLLFGSGLDEKTIALTAETLSVMLLCVVGQSMVIILSRAFYSQQDTRTPVFTAVIDLFVAVSVGIVTVGSMGLAGVALGISTGALVEALALGVLLWRRVPEAGLERVIRPLLLFTVGAVVAGLAALAVVRLTDPLLGVDHGRLALLVQIVLATGAGGVAYALYTKLLRIPELDQLISLLRSSLRRNRDGGAGGGGAGGGDAGGGGTIDPDQQGLGSPGMVD
jgi:putative peptidoglycan lipid II flippase